MTNTDPKDVDEVVIDILNAKTDDDANKLVDQFAADGGDILELLDNLFTEREVPQHDIER